MWSLFFFTVNKIIDMNQTDVHRSLTEETESVPKGSILWTGSYPEKKEQSFESDSQDFGVRGVFKMMSSADLREQAGS